MLSAQRAEVCHKVLIENPQILQYAAAARY